VGKEDFPLLCRIEATSQSVPTVLLEVKKDGFVKSPSAVLRCNPALLDNNPALAI
jgi:uncharacterized Zn-finger protein